MDALEQLHGNQNINNPLENISQQTIVLPIIKEEMVIDKHIVENAKVLISKKIINEEINTSIPVFREEVVIEKIQINAFVEGVAPVTRVEGEKTIIPILKEVYVKRLLLVEELHITKLKTTSNIDINETLRREEVIVERNDNPLSQ